MNLNWSTIETRWNDYKGDAKQQWGKLTDDQINATMGKREFLSTRVQEAYAMSKEDAERQISDWQSKQVEKQTPAAKS
jgi:uncharacterized protein YjbJ (UPF0337 family)